MLLNWWLSVEKSFDFQCISFAQIGKKVHKLVEKNSFYNKEDKKICKNIIFKFLPEKKLNNLSKLRNDSPWSINTQNKRAVREQTKN